MEKWNIEILKYWPLVRDTYGSERILRINLKINYSNCQKLLQTHYSIIPMG